MKCPYCKSRDSWKMRKQRWMRVTPGDMKNMRCSDCGAEYTRWNGFLPLRHSTARRLTILWHALLWVLLCLTLGYAIPTLLCAAFP